MISVYKASTQDEAQVGLMQSPPEPRGTKAMMSQFNHTPFRTSGVSGSSQSPESLIPLNSDSSSSSQLLRSTPIPHERTYEPKTPRTMHRKVHDAFSGHSSRPSQDTSRPMRSQTADALPSTEAMRQSLDGGIRIAGGPLPSREPEVTSLPPPQTAATPLPPPYSHYTS